MIRAEFTFVRQVATERQAVGWFQKRKDCYFVLGRKADAEDLYSYASYPEVGPAAG